MSAVERLRRAADVAGTKPTHKKAIDAAWAAIHQPHLDDGGAEMGDAFRAWCATEDFDKWPGYLSGILRATYSTPAEVAASLHRAADAQEKAEAEGRGFDIRQANAEARARQQAEHDEALDLLRRDPDAAARQLVRLQAHLDVEREQRRALEAREREAIFEAGRYRLLWNSAAACLQHNRKRLAKPRGADERRMLAHADTAHGPVSAGTTDGWLDWLDDPSEGKTPVRRVQHLRLFEGAILGRATMAGEPLTPEHLAELRRDVAEYGTPDATVDNLDAIVAARERLAESVPALLDTIDARDAVIRDALAVMRQVDLAWSTFINQDAMDVAADAVADLRTTLDCLVSGQEKDTSAEPAREEQH